MNILRIRYSNGRTHDGIILSLSATNARVAMKDADDVAEFRLVGGQWLSDEFEPVVFEFPNAPVLQALLWSKGTSSQPLSRYVN